MQLRLVTSFSKSVIKKPKTVKLILYFNDGQHPDGFGTNVELYKFLAEGGETPEGRTVPARNAFAQWKASESSAIKSAVLASSAFERWAHGEEADWSGITETLLQMFQSWVREGNVQPANAARTVQIKKSAIPLVDSGALIINGLSTRVIK